MGDRKAPGRRGRPQVRFIDDPARLREQGRLAHARKQMEYEDRQIRFGERAGAPPRAPSGPDDEGLIFASRAGLLAAQSVTPILKRAGKFRAWMSRQRSARGPTADLEQKVQTYIAIEAVDAIKRKRSPEKRRTTPSPSEVRDVLQLLFDARLSVDSVKKRLQRIRSEIAAFRPTLRAERLA